MQTNLVYVEFSWVGLDTDQENRYFFFFACFGIAYELDVNGYFAFPVGATKEEVENHMNQAKASLGKGQLADALSHYHSAIGTYVILFCFSERLVFKFCSVHATNLKNFVVFFRVNTSSFTLSL